MDSDLTAISTFGWFTTDAGDDLTAISTFGWFLGTPGFTPDILYLSVIANLLASFEVER